MEIKPNPEEESDGPDWFKSKPHHQNAKSFAPCKQNPLSCFLSLLSNFENNTIQSSSVVGLDNVCPNRGTGFIRITMTCASREITF